MVKLRLAVLGLALALPGLPALADEFSGPTAGRLAPADEYFGRMKMSVLGIANTIRDAGKRLEEGSSPNDMLRGPLYFAVDAIRDWEHKYPSDHWIPRDLMALETVYLRAGSQESYAMARRTAHWIAADYPGSPEAHRALAAVGEERPSYGVARRPTYAADRPSYAQDADDSDDDGGER
ncbi:MAG TPA: hypothetical protein VMD91_08745 [Candidatus Sulfotelmatobacter sp.]|nr:hypothetical protein [Candidatus Sulfotelmatobacter sp.]